MKTYNLKELRSENISCKVYLNGDDVIKINQIKNIIENREQVVGTGDIIRILDYKLQTHKDEWCDFQIEKISDGRIEVCKYPNPPHINFKNNDKKEIYLSISGGPWKWVKETEKFKFLRKENKIFWTWNNMNTRTAGGGIHFKASINIWKLEINKEDDKL